MAKRKPPPPPPDESPLEDAEVEEALEETVEAAALDDVEELEEAVAEVDVEEELPAEVEEEALAEVDVEEEVVADVEEEAIADVDEEVVADAEEAVADIDTVAEAEEEAVEVAAEEAVEEPVEEERPKPATSLVNLILFIVNLLAAVGFSYLVILDYAKRHAWSQAILRHDLALQGAPIDENDNKSAASSGELGWPLLLDPEVLKDVAGRRGVRPSEPFQPASEVATRRINPDLLDDETLKAVFRELNAGKEVKFVRDELKALSGKLPSDIEAAAAKIAEKGGKAAVQRKKLRELLLPLAVNIKQVKALDDAIRVAPAKELDAALVEAATRRLYADFLIPLEVFRALDLTERDDKKPRPLEQIVQVSEKTPSLTSFTVSLDSLKEQAVKRLEEAAADEHGKRDSVDRRRQIGFLLFHLSQLKDPAGEPLYSRDRVELLIGLQQLIQAADTYAVVLGILHDIRQTMVVRDRGYYTSPVEQRLYDENIDGYLDSLMRVFKNQKKTKDVLHEHGFGIDVPNAKQFRDQLRQALAKLPAQNRNGPEVLKQVKVVMAKQNVVIPPDPRGFKVDELAFDREVIRLLDSREPGYVGAQKELVARIQDLMSEVRVQENQLQALQLQEKERTDHLANRQAQEKEVVDKLLAARAETKRLANQLRELQQQVFRAQVELSDVEKRNRDLEQSIRKLERKRGGRLP